MDEKREDHPLWNEFVKWMGVRHGKGLPHSQDDWHCFLAGAEAAFMKGGPYAAAKRKQALERIEAMDPITAASSRAKLDRLLKVVEEETGCANEVIAKLDKIIRIAETPSLASEAVNKIDRLNDRLNKRLDTAFGLSHKMTGKLDQLVKLASTLSADKGLDRLSAKIERLLELVQAGQTIHVELTPTG